MKDIPMLPIFHPYFQHIETGAGKADALRRLADESPHGMIKFNATGYRYVSVNFSR